MSSVEAVGENTLEVNSLDHTRRVVRISSSPFMVGRNTYLIFWAICDKAVDEFAGLLFPRTSAVIFTAPAQPRALSGSLLAEMTAHHTRRAEILPGPEHALASGIELASPEDVIFITGSLYLVGELRRNSLSPDGGQAAS
jgi:dihydrofolate synthase/folylpolyglutamate synthase